MIPIFVILCLIYFIFYYTKKTDLFTLEQVINQKYLNKLNIKDIKARGLGNKNIQSYYHSLIRKPNSNELHLINSIFKVIKTDIGDKYKTLLDIPILIYIFRELENNFPHTHHNAILIPEIFPLNMSYQIKNTLLHEKIHIIQRFKKDNFYNLYENYWKFRYLKIKNLARIEKFSRTNPDGLDNNWVYSYQGIHIVILSLYNKNYKDISDVSSYGIYLDGSNNIIFPVRKKKLNEIKEFTHFFGNLNANNYHPNEISADMLSMMLLGKKTNTLAYKKLLEWWEQL